MTDQINLLTTSEVAHALAVSPRTVQRLRHTSGLPSIRLGRSVRYRPADVEAFIEGNLGDCQACHRGSSAKGHGPCVSSA